MQPHAPDARLSNYRLGRLIGTGGMGSVYLARDLTLQRDVAIKFIAPELAGDESARRRLLREARAAAALDHPNICGVHEVIVGDDGRACIVMQYVEGDTLAESLRQGPIEPRQTLAIASEMAAALADAHRHGVIHRDIKPQNIIVTPSGHAKLLDFGIARVVEPPTGGQDPTKTSLTGPGVAAGTPAYMSPEQVRQQPVDARSDLFSLGAVIYEALTGRRAFSGPTVADIYGQILQTHPPAPSTLRPGLSEQHDELVRRLLAKHPQDRFASADELAGALRVLSPDTAHPAPAPSPPEDPRWPSTRTILVLAASLVILAAIGVWKWNGTRPLATPPPQAQERFDRGVQQIRDGSYHGGVVALNVAIAEFGDYPMAYARLAEAYSELDEGRNAQLALLRVTSLVPDLSRVPLDDRLRLDAIRLFVTRDVGAAVEAYRRLADRHPQDAGAWVDLGRAQEAAGDFESARASYEQAIRVDALNAAAHLRRALILTDEGHHDDAVAAFAEAERLYAADSNVEGQAEVLLRRGTYLTAIGDFTSARDALEAAGALASSVKSGSHDIRVQLGLAGLTAAQGHFSEAVDQASGAVERAQDAGLAIIAAEGLNDLANVLMLAERFEEAESLIARAIQIARSQDAERTTVRSTLNLASIRQKQGRPADVLAAVESTREIASKRYQRFAINALLLASRAHEDLDDWDEVQATAAEALAMAEAMNDSVQTAEALLSLAAHASETGALPDALPLYERAEAIYRRQQNAPSLAYNLTNRAELLARLGRYDEAEAVLKEVDAGAAAEIDVFLGRVRRCHMVRALIAAFRAQWKTAADHARAAVREDDPDSTHDVSSALLRYTNARLGRRTDGPPAAQSGEPFYWELLAMLESGEPRAVHQAVAAGLDAGLARHSPEVEWRLAAIGAIAATRAGDGDVARRMADRAEQALQRLRTAWGEAFPGYASRADLVRLRQDARLKTAL
jgi:tetratricopeptide (TPR) repeat protein/predicted Ser/Thr protein kinase